MSDQTMNLDDGSNNIDISVPVFGYSTIIDLPFDIVKLDNGKYDIYDAGTSYDVRMCECDIVLSSADTAELRDFLSDSTKGRASNSIIMTLPSGSGFHPFGPDIGDTGVFTVAMEILSSEGIGADPWLYFKLKLRIVNQGNWPAYSLPTEVADGSITIDGITEIRFPPDWFKPVVSYASYMGVQRSTIALFVDRSSNADSFDTAAQFVCNESKMAALVNQIITSTRATTFTLVTGSNQYPFDYDKGVGSDTVRIIQDKLVIKHVQYDRFTMDLAMSWES